MQAVTLAPGVALWLRLPTWPLGCPWRGVVEEVGPGAYVTVAGLPFQGAHRQRVAVSELTHLAAAAGRPGWSRPVRPQRVAELLARGEPVGLPLMRMVEGEAEGESVALEWARTLGAA